mgnify:CR=1 FL=1
MSEVKLNRDICISESPYREEIGFYPKGTLGTILDFSDIKHLPDLTPERNEELMDREFHSKERLHFLLKIKDKIVSFHVRDVKFPIERS